MEEDFLPTVTSPGAWNDSSTLEAAVGGTTERPWRSYTIYIVIHYLWIYCPPFILLLGIFGNVMTIVIMRRLKSDDSVVNIYFTAMAMTDTVVLCLNTLDQWIQYTFDLEMNGSHSVACKISTWFYTGAGTISCWYLVSMTVHRAMSVVWPHRVSVMCTRRTVILVLTGITVFFAALYSHYAIGFERVYLASHSGFRCTVKHDSDEYIYFLEHYFAYIELLVYCILPFVALVVSNGVLVWKLAASVKVAGTHLTQGDPDQALAHRKAANSVTLTVVTVSVAFMVLTLPASVSFILHYFAVSHERVSGYELAQAAFVERFTFLLIYLNHAVNFYLYCLTGRRFREEFVSVVWCGRNRRGRGGHQ
ncbi:uncharacterized protein LOC143289413 [Babylonia areolata]|uniref:uncharacterized protein LOC143289413 n=1 Tax=Babylonia areolata TaxID=304850 RepID=UPI003FD1500D